MSSAATREAERPRLEDVTIERTSADGTTLGRVTLDPTIFSVPLNGPLLHQVVTAQLAGRRSGTQSTRTRAEVRGGSAKPYRQKGTGNARQGSIRAPHYSGGGVALGPKPRSYAQKTPRKMTQQALRCALSDRARNGGMRLIDRWTFEVPRTKDALAALGALSCEGTVLVVLARADVAAAKSFANLPEVVTIPADQLKAYDVLGADVIVFTDETLLGTATEVAAAPAKARRAPAKAAAAVAPAAEESAEPVAEEPAPDAGEGAAADGAAEAGEDA